MNTKIDYLLIFAFALGFVASTVLNSISGSTNFAVAGLFTVGILGYSYWKYYRPARRKRRNGKS